jgi:hypothetical protein
LSRQDPEWVGAREVFRAVHGRAAESDDMDESAREYLRALEQRLARDNQAVLQQLEGNPHVVTPAHGSLSLSLAASMPALPGGDTGVPL